jgi:Eukaryotic aspartyl protease
MSMARIPITNIYMAGDYTGVILVGPAKKAMNVILDTGSSALALDGHKYHPAAGDQITSLAQTDSYGDGSSWTGAVIQTSVMAGTGADTVVLPNANLAVAYDESANMFRSADGILGLAYAPLDDAFQMPEPTWPKRYSATQVQQGVPKDIQPYLTQLAGKDIVSDKVSFYTRRSFIHAGGGASDPLNHGWMIVGGGEEATELYTGSFQVAKVLADEWYSTNLKAVKVGAHAVHVRARGMKGMPSNSIVDSGTNSLNLGPTLLKAIFAKFTASQQALLNASVFEGQVVAASDLDLSKWPALTFVLQGDAGDVSLSVAPSDYWQIDAEKVGAALAAITVGTEGLAILGLPLMNGYFTIFDGEADNGKGAIRFATRT